MSSTISTLKTLTLRAWASSGSQRMKRGLSRSYISLSMISSWITWVMLFTVSPWLTASQFRSVTYSSNGSLSSAKVTIPVIGVQSIKKQPWSMLLKWSVGNENKFETDTSYNNMTSFYTHQRSTWPANVKQSAFFLHPFMNTFSLLRTKTIPLRAK